MLGRRAVFIEFLSVACLASVMFCARDCLAPLLYVLLRMENWRGDGDRWGLEAQVSIENYVHMPYAYVIVLFVSRSYAQVMLG